MRRQQTGYLFHRGKSWFIRFCDDVLQPDHTIKRKLVCKKLSVEYGDQYRTKASVRPFVQEILAPINSGLLTVESTMLIADFVENTYLRDFVEKQLRASTQKRYRDIWEQHVKHRLGKMTLRQFRTVDGEQLLAKIARDTALGRNSLKRIKSFLSGVFAQAKRLGILDSVNPVHGVSIPRGKEAEETYAYTIEEIKKMLAALPEPARTVVLTAAFTGLRKGEIWGLCWEDFTGKELNVNRSVWNGVINPPKTSRSKAPVPVVKELADALEDHRQRMGKLAVGYIFQGGGKQPLNLDNLARRTIIPAIEKCVVCRKSESDHKPEGHLFKLDESLRWHGWHAFRRGLATNLHQLGVDDKTIQAILRHSNISLTMNVYVKSVASSGISAMDLLGEEMKKQVCNEVATNRTNRPN
ncbi:MAG TPA: site-specific integrase [Candidatus Saccharimonadales bacterium]|jgi:integrase|nr:site-specific integrase [Candidatus Saccharimonadales bacterium]